MGWYLVLAMSIPKLSLPYFKTACPSAFLFPETPVNSQAKVACTILDDSFLPGGMITANCSANNTWNALDMSQCTFRNDAPVTAVAVVVVNSDSAMQKEMHDYEVPENAL